MAAMTILRRPAGDDAAIEDLDPAEVIVFKLVRADVDGDGELETCFSAGVASEFVPAVTALVDDGAGGDVVVLVPRLWGFRDLRVTDLDGDGRLEITTIGRQGSGAFLSVAVHRWDGDRLHELFSGDGWHQGLVEFKDLDADGADELVLWSSNWDTDEALQGPKRYTIEVFHYRPEDSAYRLSRTHETDRRYRPNAITSSGHGGPMGVSMTAEERFRWVEQDRQQLRALTAAGQVTEEVLEQLDRRGGIFASENFHADAMTLADLVLEGADTLADADARAYWRTVAWQAKAVSLSLLGRVGEAIACYRRAIQAWTGTGVGVDRLRPYFRAGMRRELAMHLAMAGDYEEALANLAEAEIELGTLDQQDPEIRSETSRLYSNRGLVAMWLGDGAAATAAFERAIELDTELDRRTGLAINHMSVGNLHRDRGDLQEAIRSYERALTALGEVSDRDREADARLELGRALLERGRHEQAVVELDLALLLSSVGNVLQQGARHHLYLGVAGQAMARLETARRYYAKARDLAWTARTPETRWQALYGLAQVDRDQRPDQARASLAEAIDIIEQLRSQYLPEALKLTMLAPKSKPYEDMVLLAGSAPEAFDYVERAKSRVFVEGLAATALAAGDLPADLVGREAAAIQRLRELQAARLQPRAAGEALAAGVEQAERDLRDLWVQLREAGPRGEEYVALRSAAPSTFPQVRDLLAGTAGAAP